MVLPDPLYQVLFKLPKIRTEILPVLFFRTVELAVEKAKRLSKDGKVLFLCFNRYLKEYLQSLKNEAPEDYEGIALYAAHLHKDMESLDDDNILALLTPQTTVMHDHNKVNYNEKYSFKNVECNQHLQRDLQKSADDTGHPELLELKELISKTIKDRKDLIASGVENFEDAYTERFEEQQKDILDRAEKKNRQDFNPYFGQFEQNLIERIREYHDNYFLWIYDFSLPTTDNLSERALRCVKSHMKISGQFESEKTAGYFAKIKSYVETCRRNGINEIQALTRLCKGNPYTVKEIFSSYPQ